MGTKFHYMGDVAHTVGSIRAILGITWPFFTLDTDPIAVGACYSFLTVTPSL